MKQILDVKKSMCSGQNDVKASSSSHSKHSFWKKKLSLECKLYSLYQKKVFNSSLNESNAFFVDYKKKGRLGFVISSNIFLTKWLQLYLSCQSKKNVCPPLSWKKSFTWSRPNRVEVFISFDLVKGVQRKGRNYFTWKISNHFRLR